MNKPLIKNAWDYFRDNRNWTPIWADGQTGLNIEKLNGVACLRLGIIEHEINEYVRKDYDPVLYFVGARHISDIHKTWQQTSLNNEEIKDLIRLHWEEDK